MSSPSQSTAKAKLSGEPVQAIVLGPGQSLTPGSLCLAAVWTCLSLIYLPSRQTDSIRVYKSRFCNHTSLRNHYITQPYLQQNRLRNVIAGHDKPYGWFYQQKLSPGAQAVGWSLDLAAILTNISPVNDSWCNDTFADVRQPNPSPRASVTSDTSGCSHHELKREQFERRKADCNSLIV